ncbi:MAG: hypothetical protein N3B12_02865, partial [Armatimonadetes bacterium]|nr:hypothetical protein [Armatimonadota bacterium]
MTNSRFFNPTIALLVSVFLVAGMFGLAISRETPVGTLKGRITALESGAPIEVAVSIRRAGVPEEYRTYRQAEAVGGNFVFNRVPTGTYLLQARSHWRPCPPIKVTIEEGKTETVNVELAPGPPRLDLYVHQHIFTPDERAQVICQGYVESGTLYVCLYRVDLDELFAKSGGNLYALIGVKPGRWFDRRFVDLSQRPALKLAHAFSSPITRRETEGNFTRRINLPHLGPGVYVMSVSADGVQEIDWVMVTSLGLITKSVGQQILGFVVDLKTGEAVGGANVKVYDGVEALASGKTDSDGLVDLRIPVRHGSYDRK